MIRLGNRQVASWAYDEVLQVFEVLGIQGAKMCERNHRIKDGPNFAGFIPPSDSVRAWKCFGSHASAARQ